MELTIECKWTTINSRGIPGPVLADYESAYASMLEIVAKGDMCSISTAFTVVDSTGNVPDGLQEYYDNFDLAEEALKNFISKNGIEIYPDYIAIRDYYGEIVRWLASEWEEDPSIVTAIATAINVYHADGSNALRQRLNSDPFRHLAGKPF